MNRYICANDAIHAPTKLKRAVCRAKSRRPLWVGAAAAVTAAAIALAVLFWPGSVEEAPQNNFPLENPLITKAGAAEVLAEPTYPKMNPAPDFSGAWTGEEYDAWEETRRAQWQQRPEDDSALYDFYDDTAREFLLNADGENALYSPLNLYISLGMLAEITDGESREQILDVLNCETIEELRALVSGLWNVNYRDDGAVTSLLSSSLWLRDDLEYNPDTIQTLADTYYASSYSGTMGSEVYDQMFRDWLNDNTGDLLSDQTENLGLNKNAALALASTIYYQAVWENEFPASDTAPDTFHAPSGDVTVDFLNATTEQEYFWDEDFAAVELKLAESGSMWLFLPDEDKTVADLLDGSALSLMRTPYDWENRTYIQVELSIPKFDVTAQPDLNAGLQNLGVTDVFDWTKADFSPLCEDSELLYLSDTTHSARVMIDEHGCTGAAFTVLPVEYAAEPPEEIVAFTADRPFLFAITGWDGQILFLGVVNQP